MKFLTYQFKMVNLANVSDISISNNYLVLTMIDGREQRFIYGAEDSLKKVYLAIKQFLSLKDNEVLDCERFME